MYLKCDLYSFICINLIIFHMSGLKVTLKAILSKVLLPNDLSISQNLSITVKGIVAQRNINHIVFFIHTTLL